MLTVRKFKIEDLDDLELLPEQQQLLERRHTSRDWVQIEQGEHAYTGFWVVSGCPPLMLGVAGMIETWPGRQIVWAVLSRHVGRLQLLAIHREVVRVLAAVQSGGTKARYRRIEANVLAGFRPGAKWVRMLGFQFEGLMRRFDQDGNDHALYARVLPPHPQ